MYGVCYISPLASVLAGLWIDSILCVFRLHRWGKRKIKLFRTCKPSSKLSGPEEMSARGHVCQTVAASTFVPSGVWEDSGSMMVKQHLLLCAWHLCWARSSFLMDTGPQIWRPDLLKLWPHDLGWSGYVICPCLTVLPVKYHLSLSFALVAAALRSLYLSKAKVSWNLLAPVAYPHVPRAV